MNRKSLANPVFLLIALLALALPAAGGERWTVDDILLSATVGSVDISPDGSHAVWVESRMDAKTGGRVSNLVLADLASGETAQLTWGTERNGGPLFSPDGALIAFTSSRDLPAADGGESEGETAGTQLWLLRPGGGEAWPVTRLTRGIRDFAWAAADRIVFAAQEEPALAEQQRKKGKDTSRVVEEVASTPPVRLFALQLAGEGKPGKVTRLTDNDDWLEGLAASPDGKWAVARFGQSLSYNYDDKVKPLTFLVDLATGERRRLFAGRPSEEDQRPLLPGSIAWQPDSAGFYFTDPYSSHPFYRVATISLLYHHDLASGETVQVDLDWERGLGAGDLEATPDGIAVLLADGVRLRPAHYRKDGGGWSKQEIAGEHVESLWEWKLSRDGTTLLYERSTPSEAPQWYRARLDGAAIVEPRQLTELNPGFAKKTERRSEVVRWTGARGDEVEGILHYPLDHTEGQRRPLVLAIHGGPAGVDRFAWRERWAYPKILLNQKGAFVLEVNYHGSAGYGLEWVESIGGGKYYELEIPDLESGVDRLIERGLVDPDKLATLGWSNGGILSAELITRTDRYKAASIGAADVEWISDWANVDFGASFDNYYFGASPLEDPQLYVEKSPFFRLGEVTTPTIVYTGTEDRNVPPSQSWSLFRALQQLGNTDVRFLLFPGEPHGLRKLSHQRRKVEEDLAWLDRHLFGTEEPANPALKEGSPLAAALALRHAARTGDRYGVEIGGMLAPETVRRKVGDSEIEIGRFEVTRGQYAAYAEAEGIPFEAEVAFAGLSADHPVTGITYEQAVAYASWLAETTGRPYRLAKKNEVEALYKKAGGNTLDHWAGYSPNPDDTERLQQELGRLLGPTPLLEPVGSFPGNGPSETGDGDEKTRIVYDLDGNAAEWVEVEGEEGGELIGGSADRPADAVENRGEPAGAAYSGLRVVVGGG